MSAVRERAEEILSIANKRKECSSDTNVRTICFNKQDLSKMRPHGKRGYRELRQCGHFSDKRKRINFVF